MSAIRTVASAALMAAVLALMAVPGPVHAATKPSAPVLLVKAGDWQRIAAQAQIDGVTLPVPTWDACGGPWNWSCLWPGAPAQITAAGSPTCGSWACGLDGVMRIARRSDHVTIFYDLETWTGSPAHEHANPLYWLCRAARDVRALHKPGVRLIETPFDSPPALMVKEDLQAARCGAWGVDIQSQFADSKPSLFRAFVAADIEAMRDVRPHMTILAGLATNGPAGYLSVPVLVRDYRYAMAAGASGIWANAADWQKRNRCTTAQGGPGCPEIMVKLLEAVGLAS